MEAQRPRLLVACRASPFPHSQGINFLPIPLCPEQTFHPRLPRVRPKYSQGEASRLVRDMGNEGYRGVSAPEAAAGHGVGGRIGFDRWVRAAVDTQELLELGQGMG